MRDQFRKMHAEGFFLIPNPWDVGSAQLLAHLGFSALATTSSGFAASLGREDHSVTLTELANHVAELVRAVDVPVSVDAEYGFLTQPEGVAETVKRIADTGAAGISIEDVGPSGEVYPMPLAVARVEAAARAAAASGIVLTARADGHLYGPRDLADTVERFRHFADAGADALFAPGVNSAADIRTLVEATKLPINVLMQTDTPSVEELVRLGVRRASTGGALAFAAYGALIRAARELLERGTHGYLGQVLEVRDRGAFTGPHTS